MDACQAFLQLRANLGEPVESHWSDLELLRKFQFEYKRIWMQLAMQAGDWLVTSADVTVTSSVITLPSSCGKPIYLENDDGRRIWIGLNVRDKNQRNPDLTSFAGACYEAYIMGNTLVINATGVSGTWKLWYQERFVAPIYGVAGANCAATALHLEGSQQPNLVDDTYNGLGVNTYAATGYAPKLADTITDYVGSTLIATVTGTPATGDLYGTVLELPEEADGLLLARTTLNALTKPSTAIDPKYFEFQLSMLRAYEKSWMNWIETRIPGSRSVRITGGY